LSGITQRTCPSLQNGLLTGNQRGPAISGWNLDERRPVGRLPGNAATIADSDNRIDWLFESDASRDGSPFESFFADVGAFAIGTTTYEWVLEHESRRDHPNKWASF
jgi:hypothetical protein